MPSAPDTAVPPPAARAGETRDATGRRRRGLLDRVLRSRRLPPGEHTTRPWRIHEFAPDFAVEDVWAFRTPGAGPDDFPAVLAALRRTGGPGDGPAVARLLFAARRKLGALLGWDGPGQGLGERSAPVRDRLPRDLRATTAGDPSRLGPFVPVYELPDECALELANRTVHGICHLGWVPTAGGAHELRMAVLVKPDGALGRWYMAAITPFRYLVVYPALTRTWERAWRERDGRTAAAVPRHERMTRWAGRLVVLHGTAHTVGALTVEGAARHAGAWLAGELRGDDLAHMSAANSAYWLSVMSFGPPLVLLGLLLLWLARRGTVPPPFVGWALAGWTLLDTAVAGPGAGQGLILLLAAGLLLAAARSARAAGQLPAGELPARVFPAREPRG